MLILLLMLLAVVPVFADQAAVSLMNQADAAYAQRLDLRQAETALAIYQKAITTDPANVEAYWKASRVSWWLGDRADPRSLKLSYFQKGIDFAKEALKHDPNSVESHFWLAGNYGSFGETKGVLKSLSLVKPIRQEMAEVNRLNDHCEGGGGYRVLGVVDYQVPGLAGGSKKRALEELNKSLAIDPQNPFTHYYLADYFKAVGNKEKMQDEWHTLKSLQVSDDLKPDYTVLLQKGEKRFEK